MTPITEDALINIGFDRCREPNGEMYNRHLYDFQVTGRDFEIIRRRNEQEGEKFVVRFHDYYMENEFPGFEYMEQIQLLITALHP